MTQKEIFDEIKACKARIKELQREVMAENDFSVTQTKLDEMMN